MRLPQELIKSMSLSHNTKNTPQLSAVGPARAYSLWGFRFLSVVTGPYRTTKIAKQFQFSKKLQHFQANSMPNFCLFQVF